MKLTVSTLHELKEQAFKERDAVRLMSRLTDQDKKNPNEKYVCAADGERHDCAFAITLYLTKDLQGNLTVDCIYADVTCNIDYLFRSDADNYSWGADLDGMFTEICYSLPMDRDWTIVPWGESL